MKYLPREKAFAKLSALARGGAGPNGGCRQPSGDFSILPAKRATLDRCRASLIARL